MLDINRKVFDLWNNKVLYCHWKSNEHIDEGLMGLTDMDILVDEKDAEEAKRLMLECGYHQFRSTRGTSYPNVEEWLGYDAQTGRMSYIHLHFRIITGQAYNKEYCFPWDQYVLNERILDSERLTYIACPETEIIILYTRIILKASDSHNISPSPDYEKEIAYLKERIDLAKLNESCKTMFVKSGDALYEFIKQDRLNAKDWYDLSRVIIPELNSFRTRSRLSTLIRKNIYSFYYRFRRRIKSKFNLPIITRKTYNNRGVSICFIGADGAGKSSVSKSIKEFINWKLDGMSFYLGSGDNYKSVSKTVIRKAYQTNTDARKKEQNKNIKRGFISKTARFFFHIFRALECIKIAKRAYKNLKKARRFTSRGGIAIYDRFPQCQFEGIYDGPKINKYSQDYCNNGIFKLLSRREKAILNKCNRFYPDLVFKLLLSPEESMKRKPDHDYNEIKVKSDITKKLEFPNSCVIDIDATMPYEEELKLIKSHVWSRIIA